MYQFHNSCQEFEPQDASSFAKIQALYVKLPISNSRGTQILKQTSTKVLHEWQLGSAYTDLS